MRRFSSFCAVISVKTTHLQDHVNMMIIISMLTMDDNDDDGDSDGDGDDGDGDK